MPQRSKNLLEAFNTSQKAEQRDQTDSGRAAGPFAGKAAAPRAEAEAPAPAPVVPPSRAAQVQLPPPPQSLDSFLKTGLPLYVAIAAVAFILGRASVTQAADDANGGGRPPVTGEREAGTLPGEKARPVQAGQPGQPASTVNGANGANAEAEVPAKVDTSALFDPQNKYTILAAQYARTDAAAQLGWDAYSYLAKKGFDVYPLYDGRTKYQLFVGASPLQVNLDDVLAELRRIPGPSGRPGDFSTAMLVMIDLYVER